jgi:hypothetical protein
VPVSIGVMSNISPQKNARTPEQNISLRNLCKRLLTIFFIVYHGFTLFSEPNTETSGVDLISFFTHYLNKICFHGSQED